MESPAASVMAWLLPRLLGLAWLFGLSLVFAVMVALLPQFGWIFLIPHFATAILVATVVVAAELLTIAWIRNRYMDTPFIAATLQVVVGGVVVFLAGILIGSS